MPCYDPGPSDRHTRAAKVLNLLRETRGETVDHKRPDYNANERALDEMTAALCAWCGSHDVTQYSLELQMWWRDHQTDDARREAEDRRRADEEAAHLAEIRDAGTAWAKLTPSEQTALRKAFGK